MSELIICSEPDPPSVNTRDKLIASGGWEDLGSDDIGRYMVKGDSVILSISGWHIDADGIDAVAGRFGIKVDDMIFMSRHASESGKPALTVHPIGNYHENKFGGRERALVKASPALMSDSLRLMMRYNDMPEFEVCYEVTHHGPWVEKPTFFIEIGSDGRNWGNIHAAEILARTIEDVRGNDYPNVVGLAGGHYAPRFTEVAVAYKINFGHMIPNYQLEGKDDEDTVRMLRDACAATGTEQVYLHRKSVRGAEASRLMGLIESAGLENISTSDMEPFTGN
jgi:D-aminoacyl-tRNA deacylase